MFYRRPSSCGRCQEFNIVHVGLLLEAAEEQSLTSKNTSNFGCNFLGFFALCESLSTVLQLLQQGNVFYPMGCKHSTNWWWTEVAET